MESTEEDAETGRGGWQIPESGRKGEWATGGRQNMMDTQDEDGRKGEQRWGVGGREHRGHRNRGLAC